LAATIHNRAHALPNSELDKLALLDRLWESSPSHRVEALSASGNCASVP